MYSKSVVARSSQKQHSKRIISIIYFLSGRFTRKSQKFHIPHFLPSINQYNGTSYSECCKECQELVSIFFEPTPPSFLFSNPPLSLELDRGCICSSSPDIFCIKNVLLNLIQMCGGTVIIDIYYILSILSTANIYTLVIDTNSFLIIHNQPSTGAGGCSP